MKRTLIIGGICAAFVAVAAIANTTGLSTDQARTAAPANPVNLSGVAASEGTAQSFLRSDATLSISGTLPQARGGTGAGALTCAAGSFITSNGTAQSCSAASVSADAPLTGAGTPASHLVCPTASGVQSGCLSSSDWTSFASRIVGPLSGDVTTSGSTATLAPSGVTANTYGSTSTIPQITFDAKGRATVVSNLTPSLPASAISSGSFADAFISASYSGVGVCAASKWASTLSRNSPPTCTQPAFTDISGVASTGQIPNIDATKVSTGVFPASQISNLDASKITTGTFADARLTDGYSGTGACAAHKWSSTLTRDVAPTCTQPDFTDLTGTASTGQIPSLDASKITTGTLGQARGGTGAGALTCAAGDFLTSNGTAQSCATPSPSGTITNQHAESSATFNCTNAGSTLASLTMAAGTYVVAASLSAQPSAANAEIIGDIKKNGSIVAGGEFFWADNGAGASPSEASISRTVVVTFAASDSLTLFCSDTFGTGVTAGYSLVAFKLQ
jgi:hypothetical protein